MLSLKQSPKYDVVGCNIANRRSGDVIPEDEPIMIFRSIDRHAVALLLRYAEMCTDPAHRVLVIDRAREFAKFAALYPERIKEPDS